MHKLKGVKAFIWLSLKGLWHKIHIVYLEWKLFGSNHPLFMFFIPQGLFYTLGHGDVCVCVCVCVCFLMHILQKSRYFISLHPLNRSFFNQNDKGFFFRTQNSRLCVIKKWSRIGLVPVNILLFHLVSNRNYWIWCSTCAFL